MINNDTLVLDTESVQRLVVALLSIGDENVMRSFLRDVMTEKEIIEVSSRLEAARMLKNGSKYTEIVENTKLSSRTVARISQWMKTGCGGYAAVLNSNEHIKPVRAG